MDKENKIIESIDIIEPILDPELNYTGTPNPFLAYAMNGSITSVSFFFLIYFKIISF